MLDEELFDQMVGKCSRRIINLLFVFRLLVVIVLLHLVVLANRVGLEDQGDTGSDGTRSKVAMQLHSLLKIVSADSSSSLVTDRVDFH